jgi:protein kinase C substrate 80K-H
MDKTTQKSNKGGMDTAMGYYDRIEFVNVDEQEPLDGKGLGSGERIALKYENGATCWNGPARSTTIILVCYEKNEIWKVIEEEKCIYRMEAGSPAACTPEAPNAAGKASGKDEL